MHVVYQKEKKTNKNVSLANEPSNTYTYTSSDVALGNYQTFTIVNTHTHTGRQTLANIRTYT